MGVLCVSSYEKISSNPLVEDDWVRKVGGGVIPKSPFIVLLHLFQRQFNVPTVLMKGCSREKPVSSQPFTEGRLSLFLSLSHPRPPVPENIIREG